jgi:hypothetical protein
MRYQPQTGRFAGRSQVACGQSSHFYANASLFTHSMDFSRPATPDA